MQRRLPKETDQQEIERAFNLILDCMSKNMDIEGTLWAGALWSVLVHGYNASGMSYEQFCKEWDDLKHHYKPWFDR